MDGSWRGAAQPGDYRWVLQATQSGAGLNGTLRIQPALSAPGVDAAQTGQLVSGTIQGNDVEFQVSFPPASRSSGADQQRFTLRFSGTLDGSGSLTGNWQSSAARESGTVSLSRTGQSMGPVPAQQRPLREGLLMIPE